MQIRRPRRNEVINESGNGLKFGIVYFVESVKHPGMFCGMMVTGAHTNQQEFSAWYKQKRIWIPVYVLDNKIELLLEKDFSALGE